MGVYTGGAAGTCRVGEGVYISSGSCGIQPVAVVSDARIGTASLS